MTPFPSYATSLSAAVSPPTSPARMIVAGSSSTTVHGVSRRVMRRDVTETEVPEFSELLIELSSLEPGYKLVSGLPAVIRLAGRSFVARIPLANISASGETVSEAVTNLKSLVVDLFDFLRSQNLNRLGPGPFQQLSVLRGFIRKIEDAE